MVLSGRQFRGFHQNPLDMLVAPFGKRCAHYLVGRTLLLSARSAIADGLLDRPEAGSISDLQCPCQGSDRTDSRNGPQPLEPVGQQEVSFQRVDQSIFNLPPTVRSSPG